MPTQRNAARLTLFAPGRNERARERESLARSIKAAARSNRGTVTETSADSAINIHTSLTTELRGDVACVTNAKVTRAFV